MKCENCGQIFEELFSKSLYNGNKDGKYYCVDCFEEKHGEEFYAEAN